MKISAEKKKSIILYLLEKIEQKDKGITKSITDAFSVNASTIYAYIKELTEQNIIRKVKKGEYELVSQQYVYNLSRSNGDLNTDTYAYTACLERHISHLEPNVKSLWNYSFSEMINNVVDHSNAQNVEIVVEQDYLNTKVVIADDGVGIFKKIAEYFNFESLDEAICELFKGKLTTDSKNHYGEGIFFSSKMMDEFFIVSSGKIFTNNKYGNAQIANFSFEEIDGTCVIMQLSNFTHKKPHEVFDLYANVDGGFTKTIIPLKNIFDSAPVSRSQAKRVCNRLEKFKEVILDFDGVQWMGQGFAHQVFAIFAVDHPNIQIQPIHMNEEVKKMYIHVTAS